MTEPLMQPWLILVYCYLAFKPLSSTTHGQNSNSCHHSRLICCSPHTKTEGTQNTCFDPLFSYTPGIHRPQQKKNTLHFIHRLITIREHKLSSSGHLSPKTPSFLVTTSSSSSLLDLLRQNDHAKVTMRNRKRLVPD